MIFSILIAATVGHGHVQAPNERLRESRAAIRKMISSSAKLPLNDRIKALNSVLKVAEASHDPLSEATVLQAKGTAYMHFGQPEKALPVLTESLRIGKSVHNIKSQATSLFDLGRTNRQLGRFQDSLADLAEALSDYRSTGKPARSDEADTLSETAAAYRDAGRLAEAIQYYEEAQVVFHDLKLPDQEANEIYNVALVLVQMGHPQMAQSLYESALKVYESLHDKQGMGDTLNNIGDYYFDAGQPAKAIRAYTSALSIKRTQGDRQGEAGALGNIGNVYNRLGQPKEAIKRYEDALKISVAIKDRAGETMAYDMEGIAYEQMADHSKALALTTHALAIEEKEKDLAGRARTLNNLGTIYEDTGRLGDALKTYELALACDRKLGDPYGTEINLTCIGSIYEIQGKADKAVEVFSEALPITRELGARYDEASILGNIGIALHDLGFDRPAVAEFKLSVGVYQALRKGAAALPSDLSKAFTKSHEDTYHRLADLLISEGRLAEAQQVLDLLKDDEYFKYVRSAKPDTVDLTKAEKAWKAQFDQADSKLAKDAAALDELQSLGRIKTLTAQQQSEMTRIDKELQQARKGLQAFLKEAQEVFAEADADKERLDQLNSYTELAGIVRALPDHSAALYTLVTKDGVRTILTLPSVSELKSGEPQKIAFGELSHKIHLLRTALVNPKLDPVPIAGKLYDILIRPLEKDLQAAGVKTLLVSLDGPLRYLPLAALYDRQTGQWLCQKYSTSLFTPNLSKMMAAPAQAVRACGFGVTKPHQVGGLYFFGLKSVHTELASLRSTTGASLFEDGSFTAESLKTELGKGDNLVHLSTHFNLEPGDASNSFLLLGDGKTLTVEDFGSWRQGVLEGVDLLVVSACDTATPTGDGGEFESFARAGQQNGAAAVLATLWPVNDPSTGLFMTHFYELRKQDPTLTKTEAIRRSQAWLMNCTAAEAQGVDRSKSGKPTQKVEGLGPYPFDPAHPLSHPYYWAPFVLTGNVR